MNAVDENMTKYFGTFTVVSLCLGAATVLLTWAVGLPNPLLWGVLNPFAVFLAIAFCTWLLGPVGAFLAVPLLMDLTVTLGHAFADESLICRNEPMRFLRVVFTESALAWQGAGTWLREARSIVAQKPMLDPT